MKTKLFIIICILLSAENHLHAEVQKNFTDSTCCAPDSLKLLSINNRQYCMSWQIKADSSCKVPLAFEFEWSYLFFNTWYKTMVPYLSNPTITFCDTAIGCGVFKWRVRTVCRDSSFSNWVDGGSFKIKLCDESFDRNLSPDLIITPNPAVDKIYLQTSLSDHYPSQLFITDQTGRILFTKNIAPNKSNKLNETIPVGSLHKGLYFVSIRNNGKVVRKGQFIKR